MDHIAKELPLPADHAPLAVLNHTGHGIRTIVTCSCGWRPAKAANGASAMHNGHMAHRRKAGLPRADYSATVFGEGPWTGLTWNEWYSANGGGVDPFTGSAN